jgi:Tol biopolymer transport system component
VAPQAHNLFSASSCGDRYIVFDSLRDGKQLLWRTDADGSNGMQLADEAGHSECSPDGKWIFYVSKRHLYRMSTEGGTPSQVMTTETSGNLDISRDGSLVAVLYQEGSPVPVLKIGVVPASGGDLRFVGLLPSGGEALRWSPDGKGVQYLLTRGGATNVWEQPLAGGDPHPVTKFASGLIYSFAWSRDGKQLLLSKGSDNSDVILISNFR